MTTLLYKEDWEETKPRFDAWWAGEVLDRVAMAITAPRRQFTCPEAKTPEEMHGDAEYWIHCCHERFAATFFGGEAVPSPHIQLGYTAWGGTAHFAPHTIWMDPILGPEDDFADFRFDWSNPWWVKLQEYMRRVTEAGRGKYIAGMASILPPFDALSFYLGTQQLCMDMLERPEQVRAIHRHMMEVWKEMCQTQWQVVDAAAYGYTAWLPVWSPTPYYPLQVDVSCMVSPRMFEEFIMPEIQELAQMLDHSLYHLDGPGALQHLDALLAIPELDGIQWIPGDGQPGPMGWLPVLKRIQAAGKLLHISIAASEVEQALQELRPEGLFIDTSCESEAEARELLLKARNWTKVK